MATANEVETLELIKKLKTKAKSKGANLANYLSSGKEKYRKAINSMISVGSLATVVSSLILLKSIVELTLFFVENWGMPIADYGALIFSVCEIVVFIITIALGINLASLKTTPTFALASLIIILIVNGLLAIGIFPIITVVIAIIGLVRWSTFKSWFYELDRKRSKLEKQHKSSATKTRQKQVTINDDTEIDDLQEEDEDETINRPIGWIVAFVITIIVAIGGSIGFHFLGRQQGFDDGRKSGYDTGYDTGYSIGHDDGYRDGFLGGEASGYDSGYKKGYDDMWNKAMCIMNGGGAYCN